MFKQINIEKLLKKLVFGGLLFLLVIIFFQKIEFTAIDLGRHLENGKIVWQDTRVLFNNFYSYTETEFRFINHHWLSGVIYYVVYSIGSFKLLSVLNILLILGAFCLAFKLAKKRASFYLVSLLSLPVIFLLSERTEIRPEIFSYLFLFLTWFILDKISEKKNYKLFWWLVPLFFFWVNIHIYFFLGLILVGAKSVAEFLPFFIEKKGDFKARFLVGWQNSKVWILNFFYLVVVCLLNPNTFKGLLYPFNIFKNYGYEIAENKSIFYLENLMVNCNFSLFKILLLVLVFSWIARFFLKKKIDWFELIISILFIIMGLFSSRNIAIFGLVSLVIISINSVEIFKYLKKKRYFLKIEKINFSKELLLVGLILLILGSAIYLLSDARRNGSFLNNSLGWDLYENNDASIKFFQENNLNRPEAYSNEFFSEIYRPIQEDESSWLEYSEKYNINLIYFSHTDSTPWATQFLFNRFKDASWSLIYFDRNVVIMIKNNEDNKELLDKFSVDPEEFTIKLRGLINQNDIKGKFYLAGLANLAGEIDLAEEIYKSILTKQPNHRQALHVLGFSYSNHTDRVDLLESLGYLQESFDQRQRLPSVYNQMGLVYWRLEDYQKAEDYWKRALKLDRKNKSALDYLTQIDQLRLQGKLPLEQSNIFGGF